MHELNRSILKRFWHQTLRMRAITFFIVLGVVIGTAAEIATPWFLRDLINALADTSAGATAARHAFAAIATIAIVNAVAWVAWRTSGFLTASAQPRIMQNLEEDAFAYLIGHSFAFFTNQFAGSLVRKIRRLSRAFEQFADEILFRFIPIVVIMLGALVALGARFPLLAVIFVAWVALFIFVNYRISLWFLVIDVQNAAQDSIVTGTLADAVTNTTNIKLFTGNATERDIVHRAEDVLRVLHTRAWTRHEVAFAIQSLLVIAINIGLLAIGVVLWQRGIFNAGDLVLIQGTLAIVMHKFWDISRGFRHVFQALADAREMVEVLEQPHDITDRPRAGTLSVTKGKIEFTDINFHYHKTRKVLDHFSLTIAPKEKVALVGPSGAGKSTIVKLLFRLADTTDGYVRIDGQDIARMTQESVRAQIALVPQDPILFHRSLMENIRYGRRDATDTEVIDAAKKAHCHEFIAGFPDQYATLVGERGVKLSGGERQRVAIARAILKNPPILVLDEATSNLDSESEHYIQAALHELMLDKTVIVIAHRLSTIMEMDRIVVIENGRVTATGSHTTLLKRKGTYRRLWQIQAGGFAKNMQ